MQSFDTESDHTATTDQTDRAPSLTPPSEIPPGAGVRVELPNGEEIAVFNIDGEYYAIDNFCPHQGAPLSEGFICGHVVECALHGWQFDVRTGECLTVPERLKTYKVHYENGVLMFDKL
jgi:nitrite reductase/ring-hydroxylating ferredoxin subunit